MADMALYARGDGLLEPRAEKSLEFVKSNAGKLIIADISADTRTSLQNRFLNGWVYTHQICKKLNDAGITNPVGGIWTRNIFHAAMQETFLLKYEFLFNGKHTKIFESTADMSRARMCQYIDAQLRPFISTHWQIEIEDPREGYWLEVYKEMQK